jgi:hypothetical protein
MSLHESLLQLLLIVVPATVLALINVTRSR